MRLLVAAIEAPEMISFGCFHGISNNPHKRLDIRTMAAVRQINPLHLEVARHYGASGIKLFRRVILLASLPLIFTGVRFALNAALVITVAVELLSAQARLGATIWLAWETLRTE